MGGKILIVAHPDDEILWFNPAQYDKIIIVFGDFGDGRSGDGRRAALAEHPSKEKITHLNWQESNYWRDKTKEQEHEDNFNKLCGYLKTLSAEAVDTHNAYGEYGHLDHVLVHNACMASFDCPVNGKDPKLYREIKALYEKNGCWTWY